MFVQIRDKLRRFLCAHRIDTKLYTPVLHLREIIKNYFSYVIVKDIITSCEIHEWN